VLGRGPLLQPSSLLVPQPRQLLRPIGPDDESMVCVPPDVIGRRDVAGGRIVVPLLTAVLGDEPELPLCDAGDRVRGDPYEHSPRLLQLIAEPLDLGLALGELLSIKLAHGHASTAAHAAQ